MLFSKLKDIKLRSRIYHNELSKISLKFFIINTLNKKFFFKQKKLHSKFISFLLKKKKYIYARSRVVRRCIVTNRSRVSNQNAGVSRLYFREMLLFGVFPGYKKAVW